MRRAYREAHQRVWWVVGPFLLIAVVYAALYPSVPPVAEVPAALFGGAP